MKRSRFTLGPRQEASPVSPKRKLQKYQYTTTTITTNTTVTTNTTSSPTKTQNNTPHKEESIEREIKLEEGYEEEEEEAEMPELQEYDGNKSRNQLQIEYNSYLNERDMLLNQYSRLLETQMSQE